MTAEEIASVRSVLERLAKRCGDRGPLSWLYRAAVSEIDRLTRERDEAREALSSVVAVADRRTVEFDRARAALLKDSPPEVVE